MLTIKTIMSQIQEGDWFVTIDLKDAYFHIQVVQRHRRFLRFAFGGKAYQYKVLPFGLALAPRTFTKCMDAALAPLRLQGIRVLNYLDDWLILAHSRELVSRHRDIVLRHIHSLGLRMNAKKSVLLPSQRTLFLGVHLDSIQMQARLAPARISNFTACLARFKLGRHVSVGSCRRLLGLMAAASPVLPLGLLHMRPFLWWIKELRLHPTVPYQGVARLLSTPFTMAGPCFSSERGKNRCDSPSPYGHDERINDGLGSGLRRQTGERGMDRRVPLLAHKLPGTQGCLPGFDVFSPCPGGASYHSQDGQHGGCVPHKPSGRFTVAHPGQACAPSSPWSQYKFLSLRAVHVPGILNLAADFLSRQKLRPGEWMLNHQTVSQIWDLFDKTEEFPDNSGHRCLRPPVAECHAVRVSANKANSGSTMQSKGEQCPSPSHSPILALPDLVLGVNSPLVSVPLGDSDQAGLTVPAPEQDLARALEVVGMAHSGPRAVMDVLNVEVQETNASAKAPATRKLYSSKWGVIESWCLTRAIDPVNCPVGPVLEFLQERMTAGAAATTLRVYVAAIAARRELDEIPLGRHRLVFASDGLGRLAPRQFLLGTYQSSSKVWWRPLSSPWSQLQNGYWLLRWFFCWRLHH